MATKKGTKPKGAKDFEPGHLTRDDEFTKEVGDGICRMIREGISLRKICAMKGTPGWATVWKWTEKHPAFRNQLFRAQVDSMVTWSYDIVDLSEKTWGGSTITVPLNSPELRRTQKDGMVTFTFDRGHVAEAKLQIDTKKWLMERLNSERFGLKQYLDITTTFYEASDSELLGEFIASARRAGITPELFAEWYEAEKPQITDHEDEVRH